MSAFHPGAYWEARLRGQYDDRGVGDIGMSRAYNSYLYAVRRQVFRRILSRLSLDSSTSAVLDIGSGTGAYVAEWKRWGAAQLTGLDITETAVARLSTGFPEANFFKGDIGDSKVLANLSEDYDVVSAFDVLFHIVDDDRYQAALQNIYRLTKPGGWFIYSDNLVPVESRMSHYVSRSEAMILEALQSEGFEIVERTPMFVLMNDPVRTRSRVLRRWYSVLHRLAGKGEFLGQIVGAMLFPFELVATRFIHSGPGTEILLCRKPEAP